MYKANTSNNPRGCPKFIRAKDYNSWDLKKAHTHTRTEDSTFVLTHTQDVWIPYSFEQDVVKYPFLLSEKSI